MSRHLKILFAPRLYPSPIHTFYTLSKPDICGGRYQPGCTGIFWPAKGTTQPVTISKKWKVPALLYGGKGPEYTPFRDFRLVPSAYWLRAQISNHERAWVQALLLNLLYSGTLGKEETAWWMNTLGLKRKKKGPCLKPNLPNLWQIMAK